MLPNIKLPTCEKKKTEINFSQVTSLKRKKKVDPNARQTMAVLCKMLAAKC